MIYCHSFYGVLIYYKDVFVFVKPKRTTFVVSFDFRRVSEMSVYEKDKKCARNGDNYIHCHIWCQLFVYLIFTL